jgi:hypothetical protein
MIVSLASRPATPSPGDLAVARGRHWLVTDVRRSSLSLDHRSLDGTEGETVMSLSSVEDDRIGAELSVLCEVEPGRRILETGTLPDPGRAAGRPAELHGPDRITIWSTLVSTTDPRAPSRGSIP